MLTAPPPVATDVGVERHQLDEIYAYVVRLAAGIAARKQPTVQRLTDQMDPIINDLRTPAKAINRYLAAGTG